MTIPETKGAAGRLGGAVRSIFHFGDFELSSPPSRLTRDGESVHLRPQVMRALTELVEHPGEVVTREHLRQTIWRDIEHVEVERGIKTVIRELRRALGDDPKNPSYIETIRSVGYRFVAPEQVETETLVKVTRRQPGRLTRTWIALAAVVVVVGLLAGLNVLMSADRPALLIPSLRPPDGAAELALLSDRLSDRLTRELVGASSGGVDVVHVSASPGELSMSPRVARYAVDGHLSSGHEEGSLYISLELIDRRDDTIVWIGTYHLPSAEVDAWPEVASRELIEAVLDQR